MTGFGWLHLTDLHQGMSGQAWLWPNLRELFFDDLERLHRQCGPWDVVLFTGDLTQRGNEREFARLEATLGELWARLCTLQAAPALVPVPGNHDLVRPKASRPEVKLLGHWQDEPDVREEFWKNPRSSFRKAVDRAFSPYAQWSSRSPLTRGVKVQRGLLPGDLSVVFEKEGRRVGVLGLNSAFLQLSGDDYEGRLAIGLPQFHAACGGDGVAWAADCDASLLLTHHPPRWLDAAAQRALVGEIAPPGRFAAHLFGHMHEHAARATSVGGAAARREWQGSSLFGLEHFGDEAREQRSHGYAAGRIEFRGDAGLLRCWPRKATRHQGGHWQVVPDYSFTLEDDQGTPAETFALRRRTRVEPGVVAVSAPTRPTNAPEPSRRPFRVLLLATDTDLREARERTADYLRRAMGVDAVQGSAQEPPDPAGFDLAVLMQAWWWDGGGAARAWERSRPDARAVFLVDSGSDWPPRRLTERAAEAEVEAFRQGLTNPRSFADPTELPERVGEVVSEVLEARSAALGTRQIGLRPWERSYLDFRLQTWTYGHTAGGRAIFGDDEVHYSPGLYVPLDGESPRWSLGPDGLPVRMEEPRDGVVREPGERRVPLARWVSTREIRRLVVVGAPGGGKTVFLTRIAAALGSACLGRPVELESQLVLENLRDTEGQLPVPVVLEATRIARRGTPTFDTLFDEIADELGSAPGDGRPADMQRWREDLHEALKAGRYILLVDALDEVSDATLRTKLLDVLKGLSREHCLPSTRILLATRSARYTGQLAFGPEFEVTEVAPMNSAQVAEFCHHWSQHPTRGETYRASLVAAVEALSTQVENGPSGSFYGNPMMLMGICIVYERYKTLPEDRAQLCSFLVDDLCRSRQSADGARDWKLGEASKRELLEHIALGMQQDGAQAWSVDRAEQVARNHSVPKDEADPSARARRHLQWTADHTGLLRFQQPEQGAEEVRFWHRMFREYLAASRLAKGDRKARELVEELWQGGRLEDPFWEDVFRLLPRPLGSERAEEFIAGLREVADEHPEVRGRAFGLAMAGIIESRDLFLRVDVATMAEEMAALYEKEGAGWRLRDRLLFLEGLGRLDPKGGDPRVREMRWVRIEGGMLERTRDRRRERVSVAPFEIAWAPVTVQQYREFVEAPDCMDERWWEGVSKENRKTVPVTAPVGWRGQLRHPNWPVTKVSQQEAQAFCRWITGHDQSGFLVRLPSGEELELAARGHGRGRYPWGDDEPGLREEARANYQGTGLGHPTPVGAFPANNLVGLADLAGNVWELTKERTKLGTLVAGGSWWARSDMLGNGLPFWVAVRDSSIGFRCVRVPTPSFGDAVAPLPSEASIPRAFQPASTTTPAAPVIPGNDIDWDSLAGPQFGLLSDAIQDAFPTPDALRIFMEHSLGKNLHALAGSGPLPAMVHEVLVAARAQGWLRDLYVAAVAANPGNRRLASFGRDPTTS